MVRRNELDRRLDRMDQATLIPQANFDFRTLYTRIRGQLFSVQKMGTWMREPIAHSVGDIGAIRNLCKHFLRAQIRRARLSFLQLALLPLLHTLVEEKSGERRKSVQKLPSNHQAADLRPGPEQDALFR
jgi:hypothetical protein